MTNLEMPCRQYLLKAIARPRVRFIGFHLHNRIQLIPKHRAELLNRQLGTSISDEQNGTAVVLFLGGQRGALASAH